MRAKAHFVYLARAADGSYYCGYATDPPRRVEIHNSGRGSKILLGKRPVCLVYTRRFSNKNSALRYEAALKRASHARKHALCAERAGGCQRTLEA